MKARFVVWNGPSPEYRDDAGFKTLNEYRFGPIRNIPDTDAAIAEEMQNEVSLLYPDFQYNHAQLLSEEDFV